jgi:hypothetical protein
MDRPTQPTTNIQNMQTIMGYTVSVLLGNRRQQNTRNTMYVCKAAFHDSVRQYIYIYIGRKSHPLTDPDQCDRADEMYGRDLTTGIRRDSQST